MSSYAQELSRGEINNFKTEGKQLISYFEFALNAIGDNDLSPKEKDIIISESYLKMFRDAKVQIEDDLDANREAVTNKDVQAYLKDVDFFFKYAHFKFNILSIDLQIDENNNPFLLTNVLRTLDAIGINGDTIKNDQQRFIEIKLDSDIRDLKIASIYTTKLNENEENIRWWNSLPQAWKNVLGDYILVSDSIVFSSISILNENYFILDQTDYQDSFINSNGDLINYNLNYDTIQINDSGLLSQKANLFNALKKILDIRDLNIQGNTDITNLEPISKLSNLRTMDISYTQIRDIYPVRNLTKLHNLNCSNTHINSVEALMYSMGLSILNISNTEIYNIEPISNLDNLIILNISNTEIDNLEAIANMKFLEDLRMRNTLITDLSPLKNLTSLSYLDLSDNGLLQSLESLPPLDRLKALYCNNTMINNLSPLSRLPNLEILSCENAEITSLASLELLPNLKKVYCDNNRLGRQKAIDFMKAHPQILVVYESKQLQIWWNELPNPWKKYFAEIVRLDPNPSKEQLHEITTITEIDISGNKLINSLIPLEKLKNIQKLNISETAVESLDGIVEAREMHTLNLSNTPVKSLHPIESLNLIEDLTISFCPINDLSPLRRLVNLKYLTLNNTQVKDLAPLNELQNLRYLNADNTLADKQQFERFTELKNEVLIIYQSEHLLNWWENLSVSWKSIFSAEMSWTQEPNSEDLHKLIKIQSIEIKENRSISDVKAITELTHLRKLTINDSRITDISPLKDLSYLKEIDLSRNPIIDLNPISKLKSLEFIYLNNTPIDNLEWIIALPNIRILDISGTEIKKLNELSNQILLERLIAYNTKINNLKPLEDLRNLIVLKIYNSRVSARRIANFQQENPNCAIDFY